MSRKNEFMLKKKQTKTFKESCGPPSSEAETLILIRQQFGQRICFLANHVKTTVLPSGK